MAVEPGANLAALSAALNALLPLADPERAETVLRQAIVRLATAEDRRPLTVREPINGADLAAWEALKVRLRGSGISNAAIGAAIGSSKSALDHLTGPGGRAPSTTLFNKLKAWLEEHQAVVKPPIAPKPNGKPAPAADPDPPASRSAARLTEEQCRRLTAYTHLAEHQIRARFQVSGELLQRAAAGAALPPEVHEHISRGLAGRSNGAA